MHILFVTVDVVSAVVMRAMGCNIAQASLGLMFVVMSDILFKLENFCHLLAWLHKCWFLFQLLALDIHVLV
jgi:hypothetical protein